MRHGTPPVLVAQHGRPVELTRTSARSKEAVESGRGGGAEDSSRPRRDRPNYPGRGWRAIDRAMELTVGRSSLIGFGGVRRPLAGVLHVVRVEAEPGKGLEGSEGQCQVQAGERACETHHARMTSVGTTGIGYGGRF